MCPVVVFVFDLETLVGQMNEIVFVCQVVVGGGSSDISLSVEKDAEVFSDYCPYSDVEFPCEI